MQRLKYVSRFSAGFGTREDIEAVVEASMRNNRRDQLTGALLAIGGLFVQILEGPLESIERTFARIRADERHHDIVVVRRGPAPSRLFGTWSMRLLELDDAAKERARPVLEAMDACMASPEADLRRVAELDDALWRVVESSLAARRDVARATGTTGG